jgi:hypothetical protein
VVLERYYSLAVLFGGISLYFLSKKSQYDIIPPNRHYFAVWRYYSLAVLFGGIILYFLSKKSQYDIIPPNRHYLAV